MTKKLTVVLLVLFFIGAIGVIVSAGQEQSIPVNMKVTGTIISIGQGTGLFDVNVKGQPGTADVRGVSFSGPQVPYDQLPAGNECAPGVDGLLIQPAGQFNMIFSDGSMLFGMAAEGGYVCFAPPKAYAPYDLVGGVGRFQGATGYVNFRLDTHPFGSPGSPVIPETGIATGEIVLP